MDVWNQSRTQKHRKIELLQVKSLPLWPMTMFLHVLNHLVPTSLTLLLSCFFFTVNGAIYSLFKCKGKWSVTVFPVCHFCCQLLVPSNNTLDWCTVKYTTTGNIQFVLSMNFEKWNRQEQNGPKHLKILTMKLLVSWNIG